MKRPISLEALFWRKGIQSPCSARLMAASALVAVAAVSQAVSFTNVDIAGPLSGGSSFTPSGNSISFVTPNAIVGDFQPLRAGNLNITYDASNSGGPNMVSIGVAVNLGNACSGSGTILFQEDIFELDSNGNEIGSAIGTIAQSFNSSSGTIWSGNILLSRGVQRLRAKKRFSLDATADTQDFDAASHALVEQNVAVAPEPATLTIFGLGAFALLKRNKK